ncbi:hypothetical protein ACSBR1_015691 [Camellia fascicularis]
MVRKILRCLPKNWEPKVTAIQEAKDLNTLSFDEFIGSLMTLEILMKIDDDDNDKKKKGITFKTSTQEKDEDNNNSSDEDGDIAMITKKFKKLLKSDKQFKNK